MMNANRWYSHNWSGIMIDELIQNIFDEKTGIAYLHARGAEACCIFAESKECEIYKCIKFSIHGCKVLLHTLLKSQVKDNETTSGMSFVPENDKGSPPGNALSPRRNIMCTCATFVNIYLSGTYEISGFNSDGCFHRFANKLFKNRLIKSSA